MSDFHFKESKLSTEIGGMLSKQNLHFDLLVHIGKRVIQHKMHIREGQDREAQQNKILRGDRNYSGRVWSI